MSESPVDLGAELNLKQVAASLGVHYMTAYRYVRTGRLEAHQVGTAWVVHPTAVERFKAAGASATTDRDRPASAPARTAVERLASVLAAGDETAAWRIVQDALSGGASPSDCYLRLLVPALHLAGDGADPASVTEDVPAAYLATATASRLVARLGAQFRRPGRTRGTVVFGAPLGEHHSLPIAVVADLVRLAGFTCLELGPNVPAGVFAHAAANTPRLVAVGIGTTRTANFTAVSRTIRAIRQVAVEVPVLIGGQAVLNPELAELAGATHWAADGAEAVAVLESLAPRRSRGKVGQLS